MSLDLERVPVLPRGVRLHRCAVRKAWLLLAPERALALDAIGAEILGEIDGARSAGAIAAALAKRHGAPEERVAADVGAFLGDLRRRGMVDEAGR